MQKRTLIKSIRNIISEFGSFKINEVEFENSILLKSIKKDHVLMIEGLDNKGVQVTEYVHETEVDTFNVDYEDLSKDVLEEVFRVCENYQVDNEKTQKRISN